MSTLDETLAAPAPAAGFSSSRLRGAAAGLFFLAALGLAILRAGAWSTGSGASLSASWAMDDFRTGVHYPTRAFWEGENPYDNSTYLQRYPARLPLPPYAPATFLVYLPFGLLPLPVASAAYFGLTIALTVALAIVALRAAGWEPSRTSVLALSGALLLSRPGHWNLLLGQVTIPAVLGVYAAMLLAHRAPSAAGAGLAVALLKPTFGVPLLVILVARGAHRAVLRGLGIAAAVNLPLLSVLVVREGGIGRFVAGFVRAQSELAVVGDAYGMRSIWRVDLPSLLSRLHGSPIGVVASVVLAGAVVGLALVFLRRLDPRGDRQSFYLATGITCCAVLLCVYHIVYDLLLLVLPTLLLAKAWSQDGPSPIRLVQAGLFTLLAGNYLTSETLLGALRAGESARLAMSAVNGLAVLGIFGLYLYQALALQPAPQPAART